MKQGCRAQLLIPAAYVVLLQLCFLSLVGAEGQNDIQYSEPPSARNLASLISEGTPLGGRAAEFAFPQLRPNTSDADQTAAVVALLYRLIPDRAAEVSVEVDRGLLDEAGRDKFIVISVDGVVHVLASTGVAAAWGFMHYLKYACHAHISWDSDQLELPRPFPFGNFSVRANDRFRYYQNVCTVSYSSVWWGWQRWRRELDWMALNGINFALAFTGQETLWRRVFLDMGLTKQEVDDYFTGPAFLAWNRMGNLKRWGGGLSESWHAQQLRLAHQIVQGMRELGITPILPAFAGHVPDNFTRAFPDSKVYQLGGWSNFNETYSYTSLLDPTDKRFTEIGNKVFPDAPVTRLRCWGHMNATYSCNYYLDPTAPVYRKIGTAFIREMEKEFHGTEHVYNCDSFNEMTPPSGDAAYLAAAGSATLQAMTAADPQAIWLMQGWLFLSDFWTNDRVQAYVTSVPIGQMIILDLYSEHTPIYNHKESYFGQPFVWCMLHDFGGQLGMEASLQGVLRGPFEGRTFPNSSMIGTGLTMEGIFQNYIIYDLMLEMGWRIESPDAVQWAMDYSDRRYGPAISKPSELRDAWGFLISSVYNGTFREKPNKLTWVGPFLITNRPTNNMKHKRWYDLADLASAWDRMVTVPASEVQQSANLQHDLVDVTREVLSQLAADYYDKMMQYYSDRDGVHTDEMGLRMMELCADLEAVLATNKDFLLGAWLDDAKKCASSEEEKQQLLYNARNQVTLWGPAGEIVDYAGKQWAGLMRDYYMPRWKVFTEYVVERIEKNLTYVQHELNLRYLNEVEVPFTFDNKSYPYQPTGNTYSLVHSMYTKYRQDIQQQIALQPLQRVVVAVQPLTADALADADVQVFM